MTRTWPAGGPPLADQPLVLSTTDLTGAELDRLAADRPTPAVVIDGLVTIGAGFAPALAAIRLLRTASALAAEVSWDADVDAGIEVWTLTHLPPPRRAGGVDPEQLRRWQRRYRYGRCRYRRGLDCALVHDSRRHDPPLRTVLTGSAASLLSHLDTWRERARLPADLEPALQELARLGLVLRLGGNVIALPWRPIRWPVIPRD